MVDRPDVVGLDLAPGLKQILDEIDAAARAVALVAVRDIGRAGRGAEAAMHARAQNAFEFADVRIGERLGGELGLHEFPSNAVVHAAEIQDAVRIEALLHAAAQPQAQSGRAARTPRPRRAANPARASASRGPWPTWRARRTAAAAVALASVATQTRPPPQSRKWASAVSLEAGGEWRRPRGSEAHPPDRAIAGLGDEFGVADRSPEARTSPLRSACRHGRIRRSARRAARRDTRPTSAKPSRRSSRARKLAPHAGGEPGRAADAERRTERARHRLDRFRLAKLRRRRASPRPRASARA